MNQQDRTEAEFSLEALQNGDQAEFARVVAAYSGYIYRLALKMLHDSQDAEDVLQDTFIKAYHALPKFQGQSKISTWLYRIATNEALMFLRKKRPDPVSVEAPQYTEADDVTKPMQIVDWCCLPENELISDEAREQLERSITQLPESLKLTFILRDIEGLSTRETAEILEVSETAVKTRLHRARMNLRESLTAYYQGQIPESV